MCGILAAISRKEPWDRRVFDRARDTLRHRGPDGAGSEFLLEGRCALGHRRLSILDLSEAGRQPMQLDHLWVVYNGEIYNYHALKAELEDLGCVFRSKCDTEVLLHGYKTWGTVLCTKLEGMFAFAIWDDQERTFYCGRDPFGQKPLYHAEKDSAILIASEIKAIKNITGHTFPMRRESFYEFLIYDYVPAPSTWYSGICELPPGHWMQIRTKKDRFTTQFHKYWDFEPDPDPRPVSEFQARETLLGTIADSVNKHLLADVEVGSLLSGGIDSNCISLEASAKLASPLKTFCIGFETQDGDERKLAVDSASAIGADHHETMVSTANIGQALERSIVLFDQPFGDLSQLPTWSIAHVAAKHVKVVLTGDGGDEVFGGYWSYGQYSRFPPFDFGSLGGILQSIRLRRLGLKKWQDQHENFTHFSMLEPVVRSLLSKDYQSENGYWHFRDHLRMESDVFRRSQWVDIKTYLPGSVLEKVDRCTMAHSLEARPPFLGTRLLETVLNLPVDLTNPNGEYKGLLRKAYSGRLRNEILNAPKSGFAGPDTLWKSLPRHPATLEAINNLTSLGFLSPEASNIAEENHKVAWRLLLVHLCIRAGYFSDFQ